MLILLAFTEDPAVPTFEVNILILLLYESNFNRLMSNEDEAIQSLFLKGRGVIGRVDIIPNI